MIKLQRWIPQSLNSHCSSAKIRYSSDLHPTIQGFRIGSCLKLDRHLRTRGLLLSKSNLVL